MQDEREEREQYMDNLEQQMEEQREQIDRTLERTTENSDRRRKALERLRSALHSLPGRTPVRDAAERETPTETIRSDTPSGREKRSRKPSEPRSWWRRIFGGS
jgi:chromosome segregation ATPase